MNNTHIEIGGCNWCSKQEYETALGGLKNQLAERIWHSPDEWADSGIVRYSIPVIHNNPILSEQVQWGAGNEVVTKAFRIEGGTKNLIGEQTILCVSSRWGTKWLFRNGEYLVVFPELGMVEFTHPFPCTIWPDRSGSHLHWKSRRIGLDVSNYISKGNGPIRWISWITGAKELGYGQGIILPN